MIYCHPVSTHPWARSTFQEHLDRLSAFGPDLGLRAFQNYIILLMLLDWIMTFTYFIPSKQTIHCHFSNRDISLHPGKVPISPLGDHQPKCIRTRRLCIILAAARTTQFSRQYVGSIRLDPEVASHDSVSTSAEHRAPKEAVSPSRSAVSKAGVE